MIYKYLNELAERSLEEVKSYNMYTWKRDRAAKALESGDRYARHSCEKEKRWAIS
jgi:hypothetical protein